MFKYEVKVRQLVSGEWEVHVQAVRYGATENVGIEQAHDIDGLFRWAKEAIIDHANAHVVS